MTQENEEVNKIREIYDDRKTLGIDYSPLNPSNYYILSSREKMLNHFLNKYYQRTLPTIKIIDIGFGNGFDIFNLVKYGATVRNIYGTEIIKERYEKVKYALTDTNLRMVENFILPYPNGLFDLVIQSTVLSSIQHEESRKKLASEMLRLLKKGGKVFSYDMRYPNPFNKDTLAIDKKELKNLFEGGKFLDIKATTFNPVLTRKIAPSSILLCQMLEKFPFLSSHYYSVIEKV
ncbi:MAG: class I SAM-dependent methyltransferase [Cyanobacteriota bacterium]